MTKNKKKRAMETVLELLSLGLARIEKSRSTDLVEFCFQGICYPCTDRDWQSVIETIGYNKITSAITKATL